MKACSCHSGARLFALLAAWSAALAALPPAAAAPTETPAPAERNTKLILPKIKAGSKPALLVRTRGLSAITAIAYAPDGKTLASGASDGTVAIWSLASGKLQQAMKRHKAPVVALSYSPDGNRLVSASTDRKLILWDLGGRVLAEVVGRGPGSLSDAAFCSEGKEVAWASSRAGLYTWDLEAGQVQQLEPRETEFACVKLVWRRDGVLLAAGTDRGELEMIYAAAAQPRGWPGGSRKLSIPTIGTNPVISIGVAYGGSAVAWLCADGRVGVSRQEGSIYRPPGSLAPGGTPLSALAMLPNGWEVMLGSAGGSVAMYGMREIFRPLAHGVSVRAGRMPGYTITIEQESAIGGAPVTAAACSPDGRSVAVGLANGAIGLRELGLLRMEGVLATHPAPVVKLVESPAGDALAACCADGSATVWDPVTQELVVALPPRPAPLKGLVRSADGTTVVGIYEDAWYAAMSTDGETQAVGPVPRGGPVRAAALSPDGRLLAWATRAWNEPDDPRSYDVITHNNKGKVTQEWRPKPRGILGYVRIWEMGTTVLISCPVDAEGLCFDPALPRLLISTIAGMPPDVWVGLGDGIARFTVPPVPRPIQAALPPRPILRPPSTPWDDLTPAGGADGTVTLRQKVSGVVDTQRPHTGPVLDIRLSHGMAFSCSQDGTLAVSRIGRIWPKRGLSGTATTVRALTFSPDGKLLATGTTEGTVVVWDMAAGRVCRSFRPHAGPITGLAFSKAGDVLASCSVDGTVKCVALERLLPLGTFADPGGPIYSVLFAPDDKELAWAGEGGAVRSWRAMTGRTTTGMNPHHGAITSLCYSPDGTAVAAGGSDGVVSLWHPGSREAVKVLTGHAGPITQVAFSRDGKRLVSASADGKAIVWDAATGAARIKFAEHPLAVTCAATDPAGSLVATGSADKRVALWDLESGQPARVLEAHDDAVTAVAFSPDGSRLASAGADGRVKVWLLREAGQPALAAGGKLHELASFLAIDGGEDWLAITPERYYHCSSEADGAVAWKLGDSIYPFDQYEAKYHRPDLLRDALAGKTVPEAPGDTKEIAPPAVAFISPATAITIDADTVPIAVQSLGFRAVDHIEVTANGRPLPAGAVANLETHQVDANGRALSFMLRWVWSDASVRLRAVAEDTDGLRSAPVEVVIRRARAIEQPPVLYVLAVGVSGYKNPAYRLRYADADARAFADAMLATQRPFYRRIVPRVLTNADATATNIRFALRWLKDVATDSDSVAIFIAGHGVQGADNEYYFGAHELDERDLSRTCLDWRDFAHALRDVRARSVSLWADTCHAGSVSGPANADVLADRLNKEAGVLVFAAGKADEASVEDESWQHGAFTKAFIDGIGGAADVPDAEGHPDGMITLRELADYVIMRVPELTNDAQHPCVPRLDTFDSGVVIALAGTRGARR